MNILPLVAQNVQDPRAFRRHHPHAARYLVHGGAVVDPHSGGQGRRDVAGPQQVPGLAGRCTRGAARPYQQHHEG